MCSRRPKNSRRGWWCWIGPNPLGGKAVEGNVLQTGLTSFVGAWKLPMRHGLTLGELAGLFNQVLGIGADLSVVAMTGWTRDQFFDQTGRFWVSPSPNMPSLETALVYPGQVLWEGTNISEGRGTTRPFEYFGAPFIEPAEVKEHLRGVSLPGVNLLEVSFRPTFQKWAGEVCRGFFLQVSDREAFRPYRTTLVLLQALLELYPGKFQWKPPPYEYETERMPIDLLIGDTGVRQALESGTPKSIFWKPPGRRGWRNSGESGRLSFCIKPHTLWAPASMKIPPTPLRGSKSHCSRLTIINNQLDNY